MEHVSVRRAPLFVGGEWARIKDFFLYSRDLWAWVFLAPTLVTLVIVAGWPLFGTLKFSFTDANLLSLDAGFQWTGLANYGAVLVDPEWWLSVRNTLFFTVVSVSLETLLGLGVALVLNAEFRGKGLLRAAVLIPWAIPTVISAKMWSWMFHDIYGVVNALLLQSGLIKEPVAWLAGGWASMAAVIFVDVWKTMPFMALLILAGLQLIPKEVDEASELDSDSRVRTFFAVTLPLLKPTIAVAVIFRSLDALRIFDLIYVLTGSNQATATVSVYARQRLMEFQEFGYGSAVSVLIFLMIAVFTSLYLWSMGRKTA